MEERQDSYPVRRCPDLVFLAIIAFVTVGIAASNYYLFARPESLVWDWHRASDGWINANLTLFAPLMLAVLVLAIRWGGLRLVDLGLRDGFVRELLLFLVAGWLLVQLLAAALAAITGGELTYHPAWTQYGVGTVLGLLIAMILGTALFEDLVFRAFLIPQAYLRLAPRFQKHDAAMLVTLFACAVFFALWHLPTIVLNRDVGVAGAFATLAYMMLGGVMLGLVFIRTGSLALTIVAHVLVNSPTLVVATPVSGSMIAGIVGVVVILLGPRLVGRRDAGLFICPREVRD